MKTRRKHKRSSSKHSKKHNKSQKKKDGLAKVNCSPNPNKKGEFYEWRMDMDTLKEFDEKDYMDALDYIGIFQSEEK